jgi:hypothetical protein
MPMAALVVQGDGFAIGGAVQNDGLPTDGPLKQTVSQDLMIPGSDVPAVLQKCHLYPGGTGTTLFGRVILIWIKDTINR